MIRLSNLNSTSLLVIFTFSLLSIIISEGLGLSYGRIFSFYLIPLFGIIFLLYTYLKNKSLLIPKYILFIYLLFLLFSGFSTIHSSNITRSFIGFLTYLFQLFVLVVSFQYPKTISKALPIVILISATIFTIYSILLPYLAINNYSILPKHGYQFVYSYFGSHNHLGDFLVLAEVVLFELMIKKRKIIWVFPFLFFLYLLLTSYSRTAYLTLGITIFFQSFFYFKSHFINSNSALIFIPFITIILLFFSFFATVQEFREFPFLKNVNQILANQNLLKPKHLTANRPYYFYSGLKDFTSNPILGVGPNNLNIIYRQDLNKINWTYTSHNYFIDILAERGLIAFVLLVGIIGLACYFSIKHISLYSFLYWALLIMFQVDYLFTFNSVLFIFILLTGTIIAKNNSLSKK